MSDEDWDSPVDSASRYANSSRPSSRGSRGGGSSRGRQFSSRGRGNFRKPESTWDTKEFDSSWGDVSNFTEKKKVFRRKPGPDEPYTAVNVPSTMVGKLIGRGGSKIEELQTESETQIVIDQQASIEAVVKIYGTEAQTAKAQELIEKIINGGGSGRTSSFSKSSNSAPIDYDTPINWAELNERCDRARMESWAKLPPLTKVFYQEDVEVANFSPEKIQEIRSRNNNIVVSRVFEEKLGYKRIPNPVERFDQAFSNFPEILEVIQQAGFTSPSPIQCQAWPVLLSGEDLIGIAQTGTGKTLAFLLPALIHIDGQRVPMSERGGPNVLVLAPTRELALQIKREVDKYQYHDIKAVCLYGGGDRREQVNAVTKGVQIIIATPGRLNDLVMSEYLKISSVTYLVLDEADRMLDMGFEPQIRKILLDIRPDRQTVMTSATWPSGVRRLAESYMDNPVQVYVGSLDLAAVHSVTQTVIIVEGDEEEKYNLLMEWVQNMGPDDKAIIFCGKKTRADHISSELVMMGVDCQSIHGDRDQSDREQALVDIADGSVKILVATDVASRGLDIQDITHVVNYDFPRNIEEYVHRVGRTGRAGRTGESITYMTKQDWSNARELIKILEEAGQEVPYSLEAMAQRYEAMKEKRAQDYDRIGGRGGRGGGGRGRGRGRGGGYFEGGGSSRQNRW